MYKPMLIIHLKINKNDLIFLKLNYNFYSTMNI